MLCHNTYPGMPDEVPAMIWKKWFYILFWTEKWKHISSIMRAMLPKRCVIDARLSGRRWAPLSSSGSLSTKALSRRNRKLRTGRLSFRNWLSLPLMRKAEARVDHGFSGSHTGWYGRSRACLEESRYCLCFNWIICGENSWCLAPSCFQVTAL